MGPRGSSGWSEDALHRWLAEQPWPEGLEGSRGHDAAVLSGIDGLPAVCADQCLEGVHFLRAAGGRAAGRKAVLRTLSDLAATAAQPLAVTLTLAAPADVDATWIQESLAGARGAALEFGAELAAGDLAVQAGAIRLSVSAIGVVDRSRAAVGRDRAEEGQVLLISGPVGGSLGPPPGFAGRHLEPRPRVVAGIAAAAAGATAMMDVSDGLAWDLYRLARASGACAHVTLGEVPLHDDAYQRSEATGRSPLEHGLHDGEDHELLAALSPTDWEAGAEALAAHGWTAIGLIKASEREGDHLRLLDADGGRSWTPSAGRGWDYLA